jgi:hypothetical protein
MPWGCAVEQMGVVRPFPAGRELPRQALRTVSRRAAAGAGPEERLHRASATAAFCAWPLPWYEFLDPRRALEGEHLPADGDRA